MKHYIYKITKGAPFYIMKNQERRKNLFHHYSAYIKASLCSVKR